jgi:hypothetical protein
MEVSLVKWPLVSEEATLVCTISSAVPHVLGNFHSRKWRTLYHDNRASMVLWRMRIFRPECIVSYLTKQQGTFTEKPRGPQISERSKSPSWYIPDYSLSLLSSSVLHTVWPNLHTVSLWTFKRSCRYTRRSIMLAVNMCFGHKNVFVPYKVSIFMHLRFLPCKFWALFYIKMVMTFIIKH